MDMHHCLFHHYCPPRSPDLSNIDFFLCGILKTVVYETPLNSGTDFVSRLSVANVREMIGMFESVRLRMRCDTCITANSKTFGHIL